MNGRDLPEEEKARILEMHEKIVRLEEECRTLKEQLLKAKAVRYFNALHRLLLICFVPSLSKIKTNYSASEKKPPG